MFCLQHCLSFPSFGPRAICAVLVRLWPLKAPNYSDIGPGVRQTETVLSLRRCLFSPVILYHILKDFWILGGLHGFLNVILKACMDVLVSLEKLVPSFKLRGGIIEIISVLLVSFYSCRISISHSIIVRRSWALISTFIKDWSADTASLIFFTSFISGWSFYFLCFIESCFSDHQQCW